MGMSLRAYARHRGVSHQAVSKAIQTGRITPLPDGTIDAEKADEEWAARTDPALQRGRSSVAAGNASARATREAAPEMKAVPRAALEAVDEALRSASPEQIGALQNTQGSAAHYARVRIANDVLKAQTAQVRLAKLKGELVDRAKATAYVFDLARRERDAWQNWPPRVAANMAADLGVDAHAMEQVLDRYLRAHLAEMAGVKVELR